MKRKLLLHQESSFSFSWSTTFSLFFWYELFLLQLAADNVLILFPSQQHVYIYSSSEMSDSYNLIFSTLNHFPLSDTKYQMIFRIDRRCEIFVSYIFSNLFEEWNSITSWYIINIRRFIVYTITICLLFLIDMIKPIRLNRLRVLQQNAVHLLIMYHDLLTNYV